MQTLPPVPPRDPGQGEGESWCWLRVTMSSPGAGGMAGPDPLSLLFARSQNWKGTCRH